MFDDVCDHILYKVDMPPYISGVINFRACYAILQRFIYKYVDPEMRIIVLISYVITLTVCIRVHSITVVKMN